MIKALRFIFSSKQLLVSAILGVILFGCQKRSQQEPALPSFPNGMERFLRHAMITHSGIYTLVGAKPITEFRNLTSKPSEIELKGIYEKLSPQKKELYSFEEVASHFIEAYELWDAWTGIKDDYLGDNFRFFEDPRHPHHIVFVNLTSVALVLDEHYADFKNVYGEDFEPTEIIYEIDSPKSIFWEKCFSNHYLAGLLYGFGQTNAKLFSWERNKKKPGKARSGSYNLSPAANDPTIKQLPLPSFAIYLPLDEKVRFYKAIRKEILELYEGKSFMEITMNLLKDDERSLTVLLENQPL